MLLLVTILKEYRHVEELMLGFVELEVGGSTVIEGSGMGEILGNLPILSSVRQLFPKSGSTSHVVLTATNERKAAQCMTFVREQFNLEDSPGAGIIFSVPIANAFGLSEAITTQSDMGKVAVSDEEHRV